MFPFDKLPNEIENKIFSLLTHERLSLIAKIATVNKKWNKNSYTFLNQCKFKALADLHGLYWMSSIPSELNNIHSLDIIGKVAYCIMGDNLYHFDEKTVQFTLKCDKDKTNMLIKNLSLHQHLKSCKPLLAKEVLGKKGCYVDPTYEKQEVLQCLIPDLTEKQLSIIKKYLGQDSFQGNQPNPTEKPKKSKKIIFDLNALGYLTFKSLLKIANQISYGTVKKTEYETEQCKLKQLIFFILKED